MIPFNIPPYYGTEETKIHEAILSHKISGDGSFTKRCHHWIETKTGCPKALLTTSCTHALEMSALLCGIQPGDEIITSSYTFVSTVNAFVLRGIKSETDHFSTAESERLLRLPMYYRLKEEDICKVTER